MFEVTPHHLYFTSADFDKNPLLQMNPPLRTEQDRQRLLRAAREGKITYLASDHAPHTLEEKEEALCKGNGLSGVPNLDTYGPFVTWLIRDMQEQEVPMDKALQIVSTMCAYNPGRFLGEFDGFTDRKFGVIEEGYIASITVLNLDSPLTINREMLRTRCGWSPFEGVTFPGRVENTFIRGAPYARAEKLWK